MISYVKKLRYAVVALGLLIAVQPALGQLPTASITRNQSLLGVNRRGNPNLARYGTRRGTGKVLIYQSPALTSILLCGQGNVRNASRMPQVYWNTGTPIRLPNGRQVPSQDDLVTITADPFSNRAYNTTFASIFR